MAQLWPETTVREQEAAGVKEEQLEHRVYCGETHRSLPFRLERNHSDYRTLLRKRGRGEEGRGGGGEEVRGGRGEGEAAPAGCLIMWLSVMGGRGVRNPIRTSPSTSLAASQSHWNARWMKCGGSTGWRGKARPPSW